MPLAYTFQDKPAAIPDPTSILLAIDINDEAKKPKAQGDLVGAEKKWLEALRLKIKGAGDASIQAALTRNVLGGLYLMRRRLDDAEKMWEGAERVRGGE